jgi:hypothetical protein
MDAAHLIFYIILGVVSARILTRIFGKFYKLRSQYDEMKEKAKIDLAQNPPAKHSPEEEAEDYANQTPEEMIKELTPPPPPIMGGLFVGGRFVNPLPGVTLGGGDPELMTRLEKELKEAATPHHIQDNPRLAHYEKSLGIAPGYLNLRGGDPEIVTRLHEKLKEAAEDQNRQE